MNSGILREKNKHNLILIIIHFRKTLFFISKRIPIFCIKAEKVWRLENERQHFELMLYQNLYISSLCAIKYFILMFHGNSINHIRYPWEMIVTPRFSNSNTMISSQNGNIFCPKARQRSPTRPTAARQTCHNYEIH